MPDNRFTISPLMIPGTPSASAWRRIFPFLAWRTRVTRESMRADAIAGLVSAVVVLPQGVAFATLAGLPPEYGLYAAMIPAVVAALFGSSWHLISGPTNVISIFVFASLAPLADPGSEQYIRLALTLTLLVGLMQLGLGLARLGALVNLISHTVVVSFTAGAACLIITAQLGPFFGLAVARGLSFPETWQHFFFHLPDTNPWSAGVGAATIVIALAFRRWVPRFPYMIAAMIGGTLCSLGLKLAFGDDVAHIATLGAISAALPPLSMPDLSPAALRQTLPIALAVTVLALTEAVSIARAIAVRSGQRIDGNQEFIGQGLSNVAGAFFSCYASSGSFNRSGLNYEAGARTPLAAVFAAGLLAVILVLVAPLAAHLPLAVMAAILFVVAWGLIDFPALRHIVHTSRQETGVMLVTFLAALLADLESAIYAGVLLSLVLYINRTSRPLITDVKPDPAPNSYHYTSESGLPDCPQLKMIRVNGSIFFGAVDHVQAALQTIDEQNPQQKHVLIVASSVNFIDLAGAEMLAQEAKRRREIGGGLYFYRLKGNVRDVLVRSKRLAEIGEQNLFPVGARAIRAIYPKLDSAICRRCTARIFSECQTRLPDDRLREPDLRDSLPH